MERSDPPRPPATAFPASQDGLLKPSVEGEARPAGGEAPHGDQALDQPVAPEISAVIFDNSPVAETSALQATHAPALRQPEDEEPGDQLFAGFSSVVGNVSDVHPAYEAVALASDRADAHGAGQDLSPADGEPTTVQDATAPERGPLQPTESELIADRGPDNEQPDVFYQPPVFLEPTSSIEPNSPLLATEPPEEKHAENLEQEASGAGYIPRLAPWPDALEPLQHEGDELSAALISAPEFPDLQAVADFADVANTANAANEPPLTPVPATVAAASMDGQALPVEAEGSAVEPLPGDAASHPETFTAAANSADAARSLAAPEAAEALAVEPAIAHRPALALDIGAWRAPEPALPSLDAPVVSRASRLSLHPDSHGDCVPEVGPMPATGVASSGPDFSRMWGTASTPAAAVPVFAPAAHAADIGWLPPADATTERPERRNWKAFAYRAARMAFFVLAGWFAFVLLLVVAYRFVNPPFSMLMAQQWLMGTSIQKQWVPLEQISPNLQRSVVVSEDSRFCQHWGIDLAEMANAIQRSNGGYPRGASTITMQLAKNLFLLPTKSYLRKMVELPLTVAIELTWPKARILEVYLNVVEWGPGVFGAEAASQSHFKRPASQLTPRQAAQLAVSLPNPIVRNAGRPGPLVRKRAGVIQQRAAGARGVLSCVAQGR